MVRSAEQSEQTTPLIQALISNQKAERALSAMVSRVLFGELSPRQGAELLPVSLRTALRGSDP
jgi:Trp operon repressor